MFSALIAAGLSVVVLAAPTRSDLDKWDIRDIPPLEYDLPGKVFAATRAVDPSEPLGTSGDAIPLGGASVKVYAWKTFVATLPVDATGRFVVPKGTKGTHVEVTAPGREVARAWIHEVEEYVNVTTYHGSMPRTHPERVKKKIDPKTGLLFLLRKTAKYSGRVVDGAGKPLAGATVRVRVDEGMAGAMQLLRNDAEMVTGADGLFSIDFAPGKIAVDARIGDNLCVNTVFRDKVAQGAVLSGLELVIKKRVPFRVRVTRNGEPVPGASVRRCIPSPGGSGWSGDSATTGSSGIATFDRAVEGEQAAIIARHPIGGIAGLPRRLVPPAGSTIEMALLTGATVQGFVKTPSGKPIKGVEIGFSQGDPLPNAPSGLDDLALDCAGAILDRIETNAQGYFRRSDLLHRLDAWNARKDGYESLHEWSVPQGDLRIVMRSEGLVRGRVRRPDSGPLPGRGGEIIAKQDSSTHSTIAYDDVYELKLPPGAWKIHYQDVNGKKTAPLAITVSDEPLELDFDAPE